MGATFVLVFCRWLIGLAFAVSAGGKARALGAFRSTITEFGVLPARLAPAPKLDPRAASRGEASSARPIGTAASVSTPVWSSSRSAMASILYHAVRLAGVCRPQ